MERYIAGISTKVLNERLRKLTKYDLLELRRYAESPPRTEYRLTAFGRKVVALVARIRELDRERDGGNQSRRRTRPSGVAANDGASAGDLGTNGTEN